MSDQKILLKMMKAKFIVSGDDELFPENGELIFNTDDNELYTHVVSYDRPGLCDYCALSSKNDPRGVSRCPEWICDGNGYFIRVDD